VALSYTQGEKMPVRPPRACPRCGGVSYGRCQAHRVVARRGSSTAQGYGASWRRLRLAMLQAEPLCRVCTAEGRITPATDVDHIRPRKQGGTDDPSNLQSLCHSHHSRKTSREDGGGWGGRNSGTAAPGSDALVTRARPQIGSAR